MHTLRTLHSQNNLVSLDLTLGDSCSKTELDALLLETVQEEISHLRITLTTNVVGKLHNLNLQCDHKHHLILDCQDGCTQYLTRDQ